MMGFEGQCPLCQNPASTLRSSQPEGATEEDQNGVRNSSSRCVESFLQMCGKQAPFDQSLQDKEKLINGERRKGMRGGRKSRNNSILWWRRPGEAQNPGEKARKMS